MTINVLFVTSTTVASSESNVLWNIESPVCFKLNELVVLNDSEEVYLLEYAQMINDNISGTNAPSVGLGTFGADVRSGITSVYFTPEAGIGGR